MLCEFLLCLYGQLSQACTHPHTADALLLLPAQQYLLHPCLCHAVLANCFVTPMHRCCFSGRAAQASRACDASCICGPWLRCAPCLCSSQWFTTHVSMDRPRQAAANNLCLVSLLLLLPLLPHAGADIIVEVRSPALACSTGMFYHSYWFV